MAVYSWGRGEDGQLGLGDTNDQYQPVLVEALKEYKLLQIACGSGHTVVLTEDREVHTWGRGDDGRLGHGDNGWKYVPRIVDALSGKAIRQVTCGSYHTAAVSDSGVLYTWGGGMYGKLGHGNENGHSTPCVVEALQNKHVVQIACGSRHTAALTVDGEIFTWGDKENGVSGHGDTDGHQYVPRLVDALLGKKCTQVAACGFHTAAIADGGDLYTWGEGKFGRLGHGTERNQILPRLVDSMQGKVMQQVVCGGFHSAAITDTGDLYTWGGGEHGQLGHGDKVNKTSPCLVVALRDQVLVQITCGWSHTVALNEGGDLYTWGNGDHGKLGHGDTLKVAMPRLLKTLHGRTVRSVASYNEHTSALVADEDALGGPPCKDMDSTYVADMRQLVNDQEFADITFVVEDKPVYAHRGILSARCDHFRAMFASGMKESRAPEVVIPNIRFDVCLVLLDYLYTDAVNVDPEIAIELYVAADLYTIDRLKGLCEAVVQKGISTANAPALLQAADNCHATRLREICLRYVVRHFDTVSKVPTFATLSRELILNILQSR